jgi:hypothetical protein
VAALEAQSLGEIQRLTSLLATTTIPTTVPYSKVLLLVHMMTFLVLSFDGCMVGMSATTIRTVA